MYPPLNAVTQPHLLADNSCAVLGAVWVVSTCWSPGKAFAGIKNLTAWHKMCLYCVETSQIETVGPHLTVCRHVSNPWVNPRVCLIGTLLFVWRKGKVVASSQAPWLCCTGADKRKLLEELGQSWRWGAWCLGQRRTCEPLPASLLLPTSWMTSSAAWPGLGSSSPPAPACGLKDWDNCHSSSPLKWILILCRNKFQTPQHRALLCSPPHTREGWTATLSS